MGETPMLRLFVAEDLGGVLGDGDGYGNEAADGGEGGSGEQGPVEPGIFGFDNNKNQPQQPKPQPPVTDDNYFDENGRDSY